jgi:potassium-transporting ATPase KdpC subunit
MKEFKVSLYIFLTMSLLLGLAYPLAMTGAADLFFIKKANGSMITVNGRLVGSELIGQTFTGAGYFHGRPSANNYDGINSGGSNLGPTNKKLIEQVNKIIEQTRKENKIPADAKIPADLVLSSGSGLDPHIGIDSALLQVPRISRERKINETIINNIIRKNAEVQYFGLFGNQYVNVLKLNIALDSLGKSR